MTNKRIEHLRKFYSIITTLEKICGGLRVLAECSGRLNWPHSGVYFFREAGEIRTDTGAGPRIVRVGAHALKTGSNTRLWTRLSQHKGSNSGEGNHRGSIFRLIVGASLIAKSKYEFPTWGVGNTAPAEIRAAERPLEREVSQAIGRMPFLWLAIADEPGPNSLRGYVERNAIALLSNYNKPPLDPPSGGWLGHHCNRDRVRKSGLWNSNHVDESYDPSFLDRLEELVLKMNHST